MKNLDSILLGLCYLISSTIFLFGFRIIKESNEALLMAITENKVMPVTEEIEEQKTYDLSAEFSAYTLSADETDENPCIGSRNLNLCVLKSLLKTKICASRDLPLDTLIDIEGIGQCVVLDHMNIRYKGTGNIDILMDTKDEANNFGRKPLKYNIIK